MHVESFGKPCHVNKRSQSLAWCKESNLTKYKVLIYDYRVRVTADALADMYFKTQPADDIQWSKDQNIFSTYIVLTDKLKKLV